MRRPYRERLGIILDELGAGVGGRAADIQETVKPRRPGPARDRPGAGDPRRPEHDAGEPHARRRHGDRRPRRRTARTSAASSPRRTRPPRASAERRAQIAASLQRLPTFLRELEPTMAKLGAADRRADARARRPQRLGRPARDAARAAAGLRRRQPDRLKSLGRAQPRRPAGRARRAPDGGRAQQGLHAHAGARQQPGDRPQGPQRPQPRRREGPALAGRQGLHRLRGAPAVRLRPGEAINVFDANGYMLKVNLFASECSDYQNVQSLKKKLQDGPRLLLALRRDPRPEPAGHHAG